MFEGMRRPPFENRAHERIFPVATVELLGRRREQQDASGSAEFEAKGRKMLAVAIADGHGQIGGFAARKAIDIILERLKGPEAVDEVWDDAFGDIHDLIVQRQSFGGTTLTAALVEKGRIKIAWVGNCQARVFSRDDGTLHTLTLPHEYGVHPGETGRLMGQDAVIVDPRHPFVRSNRRGHIGFPGGHIEISRALGDPETEPYVLHEPETKNVITTPDERYLVMATDGFWHCIDRRGRRKAVERVLADAGNADEASARIKSLLSRWNPDDNTTVVIVELHG